VKKDVTSEPSVVNDILDRADVLWLAFQDEEGLCSIPMNFAREDGILYVHSGRDGRKFRALDTRATIAFSCAVDVKPKTSRDACGFGYYFKSVMGTAIPYLLPKEETVDALDIITRKYAGETLPYNVRVVPKTAVFALHIAKATARVK